MEKDTIKTKDVKSYNELYEDAHEVFGKIKDLLGENVVKLEEQIKTNKKNKMLVIPLFIVLTVFLFGLINTFFPTVLSSVILSTVISVLSCGAMLIGAHCEGKRLRKELKMAKIVKHSQAQKLWEDYAQDLKKIAIYKKRLGIDQESFEYEFLLQDYDGEIFITLDNKLDAERISIEKNKNKEEIIIEQKEVNNIKEAELLKMSSLPVQNDYDSYTVRQIENYINFVESIYQVNGKNMEHINKIKLLKKVLTDEEIVKELTPLKIEEMIQKLEGQDKISIQERKRVSQ